MTKAHKMSIHVASYSAAMTARGLWGGTPTRGALEKLKKNERWCPHCSSLLQLEEQQRNEEFHRELNK